MFVELSLEEAQLLSDVIHTRLAEFDSEPTAKAQREELENLKHKLERLEHRLHEAEWDVTC